MSARKYAIGTVPRMGTVPHSAELGTVRAKTRIEQWQGLAAGLYAIGTVPKMNCAKPSHSSQVTDSKEENELCNCAPLKGGRDSGTVPEISPPLRESGRGKKSFSGTKWGRA